MSNRDSDARYEHLQQGVPFFGSELLKRVHTSLPGVVVSYDAATRRARVQPAVDHLISPEGNPNAEFGDLEPMPNPIILDVPVMHFIGGGYIVHLPLVAGDTVNLLFSERDIAAFKQTLRSGPPASDDVMEIQHAVAIPGFGNPNAAVTLAGAGLVLQTTNGSTFVELTAGHVSIGRQRNVDIAGDVDISGDLDVTGNATVTGTLRANAASI